MLIKFYNESRKGQEKVPSTLFQDSLEFSKLALGHLHSAQGEPVKRASCTSCALTIHPVTQQQASTMVEQSGTVGCPFHRGAEWAANPAHKAAEAPHCWPPAPGAHLLTGSGTSQRCRLGAYLAGAEGAAASREPCTVAASFSRPTRSATSTPSPRALPSCPGELHLA